MSWLRFVFSLFAGVASIGTAAAAERSVMLSGFERVRVQGPFKVTIGATRSPQASITGDGATIDSVDIQQDGATVTIRLPIRPWSEGGTRGREPLQVTLGTDGLIGASMVGSGSITIERMKGDKVDLTATGNGSITIARVDAAAASATITGSGSVVMAGRTNATRLVINGAGTIDADSLDSGDLTVRVDGSGTVRARARATANIVDTGLGEVRITGHPTCTVKADAGGLVTCGNGS